MNRHRWLFTGVFIFVLSFSLQLYAAPTALASPLMQTATPTVDPTLQEKAKTLNNEGIDLYQGQQDAEGALRKFAEALQLYGLANDRAGEAQVLFNIGLIYSNDAAYPEALDYFSQSIALWRAIGNREREGAVLVNIGEVYKELGDYLNATRSYKDALPIFQAANERYKSAIILQALGSAYYEQGLYKEALDALTQARPYFRALGDDYNEGITAKFAALIQHELGDNRAALADYQAALALFQAAGDANEEATVARMLGNVQMNLGNYFESLGYFNRALDIWQDTLHCVDSADADPCAEQADLLEAIGLLYLEIGEYARAIDFQERAFELWTELDNQAEAAEAIRQIGFVHSIQGNYEEAIRQYNEAQKIWQRLGDRTKQANTLTDIAAAYNWMGKQRQAINKLEMAVRLLRADGKQIDVAQALGRMAQYYAQLGLQGPLSGNEKMRLNEFVDEAMMTIESVQLPTEKAALLARLGIIYTLLGQNDKTIDVYDQALALTREVGDSRVEASILDSIGQTYVLWEKPQEAIGYFQQAITLTETIQEQIRVEELKTTFADEQDNSYNNLIQILWAERQFADVFDYAERARARTFLDQLGNRRIAVQPTAESELIHQEQALRQQIVDAQQNLNVMAAAEVDSLQNSDQLAELEEMLASLQSEYANLLVDLKTTNPEYASLVSIDTLSLTEIQTQVLDDDTSLIVYYMLDEELLAWVVDKQSMNAVRLDIDRAALASQIDFWQGTIDLKESDTEVAAELYAALLAPLMRYVRHDNLLIVPHGVLHYLSFAALWNASSQRYLVEDFSIAYAPSASAMRFIQAKQNPNRNRLLALGNPDKTLPWSEQEATAVAQIFDTKPLTGTLATKDALHESRADMIHMAAHGVYNAYNPLFTRIELAADDSQDGSLTVYEAYGLNLAEANLVVLSACETALGEQILEEGAPGLTRGDEIPGLTRAFLYAGAPAIVTTLWRIDDAASVDLMVAFYEQLRAGQSTAQALRAAQIEILKQEQWQSPYYWGAFVLHGADSALISIDVTSE